MRRESRFGLAEIAIPSADSMILRLTTFHENARSALDCGPAMRDRLEFRAKPPSADGSE